MVECQAVRWVDDEPQPGVVEVVLTDAHNHAWSLIDKLAIFDADHLLRPDATYPIDIEVECTMVERKLMADGTELAVIQLAWPPWNDVPESFEVRINQLTTTDTP